VFRRSGGLAAAVAAAAALALPSASGAADPGRWTETGRSTVPLNYYQGVASDPGRRLFFNGIYTGLYRTDPFLNETARTDDVIPPDVHAREQYNHIGDIAWDAREGGRILLPMECYYPRAAPGQDDPNNTCNTGSIGVADPDTLQWRYYVKLDPAEIPKVMWVAVSPDGQLAWTQSHDDLLAYSMDDIAQAHAAPDAQPIKAVRKLPKAKPPSGITGAAFFRGTFYVAGGDDADHFQVWSIDLSTGARQLEIEKQVVGESEGLDFFSALGGELHWLIQPYNTQGPPTYGFSNGTVLHFVPRGEKPATPLAKPAKIHLEVKPKHVRAGRRTKLSFVATTVVAGNEGPVDRAGIEVDGFDALTDAQGRATISFRSKRAGTRRAVAAKTGLRPGKAWFRVLPKRKKPKARGHGR
jgi:hypothetical protein